MRLATGGDMLNFGYWTEKITEPIQAQEELCKVFANVSELNTAKTVVDIGSGLSAPSIYWKSQFDSLEITCLNINFNQLKQSSEIINRQSTDKIHLLNATSTILPFPDNSVDRVLALESAQHMKPLDNFLLESKRILKKDGILTLAIPVVVKEKINPIVNLGILAMTWSSEHYSIATITSTLKDCNFKILETQKIGPMVYGPLADYYSKNRDVLRKKILSKYPWYLENVLFKSLQKMKYVSQTNVIDYLLIKCKS